jgi:hypothetical protein
MLIDLGLGVAASYSSVGAYTGDPWPVFMAGEPEQPDSAITVYDTAGRVQAFLQPSGLAIEHHGFQVRVRAAAHTAGYIKANAIAVKLDQIVRLRSVQIGAVIYLVHAVTRSSEVLVLGTESPTSKRKLFTINAMAHLEQTN